MPEGLFGKAKYGRKTSGMLASLKGVFVKQVKMDDLSQDDIIIAVMGPTGSGKSTFIDTITGLEVGVGHNLESCTSGISTIKLTMPEEAHGDLVFVDTPGFNDTNKSDVDILKMIADWLKSTYAKGIVLAGLLYFHRITDNRMAGMPLKNLGMFQKLCGKAAYQNVILVTTMWGEIEEEEGEERERELKSEYWRPMLERGSTTSRFMRTRESAFILLDPLIERANKQISLLLQQEMVDMKRQLPETSAGRELHSTMEFLVRQRQEIIDRIRDEMKHAEDDRGALEPLKQEHEKLQINLEETVNKMRELNLPLGKGLENMPQKSLDIEQPVLNPKYSSIQSTSDLGLPLDQIFTCQDPHDSENLSITKSVRNAKKTQENPPQKNRSNQEIPQQTVERQKVEPQEVEPQESKNIQRVFSRQYNPETNYGKPDPKPKTKSTGTLNFLEASAKQVKTEELSQDDVIILVMGPAGSGKSTFIEIATGFGTGVAHNLEPCTSGINIVKLSLSELADGDVVFVDIPESDDTHKSDIEIFKIMADWLKTIYEKEILLSGFLYFHRISDDPMNGRSLKNLRMFDELCGKNALHKAILVTTMGDEVDEETRDSREKELKSKYWRSMLSRFMHTRESALRLIEPFIEAANDKGSLLLQQEMVDMCTKLPATSAGLRVFSEMEDLVKRRQEVLRQIRNAMKQNEDQQSLSVLQGEYQRIQMQFDATVNEMRQLKLPLGKRLSRVTRRVVNGFFKD